MLDFEVMIRIGHADDPILDRFHEATIVVDHAVYWAVDTEVGRVDHGRLESAVARLGDDHITLVTKGDKPYIRPPLVPFDQIFSEVMNGRKAVAKVYVREHNERDVIPNPVGEAAFENSHRSLPFPAGLIDEAGEIKCRLL